MRLLTRHFKPDIPFSREDAHRLLPWVVGLMVCLAGLFLCAAISVHQASNMAGRLNVNSFQLYIPFAHEDKDALQKKLIEMLRGIDGIEKIESHNAASIARMVAPWVSDQLSLADLPLPVVVEVTLHQEADRLERIAAITAAVHQLDKGIEVESYDRWVDQLLQFAGMLRMLAILLASLVIAALAAMVVLASRTSLKLHFKTVQLLHNVGAQDDYITRQFVINAGVMTLMGAVPGAAAAAIIYTALSWFSQSLSSPLLPAIQLLPMHMVALVFLPLLCALIAYVAVRSSVQGMIEGMH